MVGHGLDRCLLPFVVVGHIAELLGDLLFGNLTLILQAVSLELRLVLHFFELFGLVAQIFLVFSFFLIELVFIRFELFL